MQDDAVVAREVARRVRKDAPIGFGVEQRVADGLLQALPRGGAAADEAPVAEGLLDDDGSGGELVPGIQEGAAFLEWQIQRQRTRQKTDDVSP